MIKKKQPQTEYIVLNTRKCIACWKCVNRCPNKVFRKLAILWHKHAIIRDAHKCTGCKYCINICPANALCSKQ